IPGDGEARAVHSGILSNGKSCGGIYVGHCAADFASLSSRISAFARRYMSVLGSNDRGSTTYGLPRSTDIAIVRKHVSKLPILVRKLVTAAGCPAAVRLLTTGFAVPALTLVTQRQRYAMTCIAYGGGRA